MGVKPANWLDALGAPVMRTDVTPDQYFVPTPIHAAMNNCVASIIIRSIAVALFAYAAYAIISGIVSASRKRKKRKSIPTA